MGFLVEDLRKRGVDAWGVDVSEYAISQVHESVADRCRVGSLTEPFERRYDLITCIEVLEHLPPEEAEPAIANLCAATDRILLSTHAGDFGEPTHLNVQPPEAWAAAFARERLLPRPRPRPLLPLPWAALYTRRDESQAETVRRYDRGWSRLRREVSEVRESLLAPRTSSPSSRPAAESTTDPSCWRELDAQERGDPPAARPADRQGRRARHRRRAGSPSWKTAASGWPR